MVDWSETKFVQSTREKCTFGGCWLLGPALDAFTIFFGAPVIFFLVPSSKQPALSKKARKLNSVTMAKSKIPPTKL